jgi:cyanophycinase-like exopeptidase
MAPGLVATHRAGLEAAGTDRVVVIDTPYGFQENADQLTERIATFFETSLRATVEVASLRSSGADRITTERFLAKVRGAKYVFSGPGSPSYALNVWEGIGLAAALQEVVANGGSLAFASAASLTLGRTTIPVYEIYKVGADPDWLPGMDLTSSLGLPCTVVPHWNNAEGGNHDTSRCYIGERRFGSLASRLDVGVIGVDEHTAATVDFGRGVFQVTGRGTVTLRGGVEAVIGAGNSMTLQEVAVALSTAPTSENALSPKTELPSMSLDAAIAERDADAVLAALLDAEDRSLASEEDRARYRAMLVRVVDEARRGLVDPRDRVKGFVDLLLAIRSQTREQGDYATADAIRTGLGLLGVEVRDTALGSEWELKSPDASLDQPG